MAGPSRLSSIVIVTVLSCVALGAVWGLVLHTLPQNDILPDPSPLSPPSPPAQPAASIATVPSQSLPELAAQPVVVKDGQPLPQAEASRPSPGASAALMKNVKCDMEIEALCPEEEGERQACLQRKAAQLSAPCRPMLRERLVRMKGERQQLRVACEADRKQFCRDVPLGGGAMMQCLESHAQEVSDQCFQHLPKRGRLLN